MPCIDTVQGFYFALLQYSHIQAFTARFVQSMQLYCQHSKTAHKALQGHSVRFDRFHRQQYQTGTSSYNTTCATLERITAPQHLQRIPDTRRHAGTLHSSAQPPIAYYNKVYKGAGRLCYRSMPGGVAHRRPCKPGGLQSGTLHPAGSPAAGGAEPLTVTAVSLFRAFAR